LIVATHYTKEQDGLLLPWHGRAFINPPYGQHISKWTGKFVQEYQQGHFTSASQDGSTVDTAIVGLACVFLERKSMV
jgi:hypothetical protein